VTVAFAESLFARLSPKKRRRSISYCADSSIASAVAGSPTSGAPRGTVDSSRAPASSVQPASFAIASSRNARSVLSASRRAASRA